jgi:asparagine synthetase B (glutamine-hydrolysing)
MRVKYEYRGQLFDDIRDVVYNNKLEIDYGYLFDEYLPFQVFATGGTAFKGVRIVPTIKYVPNEYGPKFDWKWAKACMESYLEEHDSHLCKHVVAAVSGGVDSSTVALHCGPEYIYSGYYDVEGYSELEYSSLVAEELDCYHAKLRLCEDDFLEGFETYIDTICTPVAGYGGVMERETLKKVTKIDKDVDGVLFGNGGDEVFLGYFFNHYVMEFFENGHRGPGYMPNFGPMKSRITDQMLDTMIVASINRMDVDKLRSGIGYWISKDLAGLKNIVDKMLHVNINMTLPSLLHVNQCMCNEAGVNGLNPMSSEHLIQTAYWANASRSSVPKGNLRNIVPRLPIPIVSNLEKRGFPIPLHKWRNVNREFRELWEAFQLRDWHIGLDEEYPGLNRVSWAVANIEMFLRRFG